MSLINKVALTVVGGLVIGVVSWHTRSLLRSAKNISSTQTANLEMNSLEESETRDFKILFDDL
jgi:hypothetical protein